MASDVKRKNPLAAFESFQRAFPASGSDDVRLVVKLNNARHSRKTEGETAELLAAFEADARVIVVDEHLTYLEVLSLNASSDVFSRFTAPRVWGSTCSRR